MPRGYRCILVAFVGWLSLAAQNPQPENKQQAHTSNQAAPAPSPYAPYTKLSEDACYHTKDHDAADLCAQWRAAIAAERAAKATEEATNWAKFATVLSAFGVGMLIVTIRQGQSALKLARESAYVESRSYLYPGIFKIEHILGSSWRCIVPLINGGNTPATDVKTHFVAKVVPMPLKAADIWECHPINVMYAALGPRAERQLNAPVAISPIVEAEILKSEKAILGHFMVGYTTHTGEEVVEPVSITLVTGHDLQDRRMRILTPGALKRFADFEKQSERDKKA